MSCKFAPLLIHPTFKVNLPPFKVNLPAFKVYSPHNTMNMNLGLVWSRYFSGRFSGQKNILTTRTTTKGIHPMAKTESGIAIEINTDIILVKNHNKIAKFAFILFQHLHLTSFYRFAFPDQNISAKCIASRDSLRLPARASITDRGRQRFAGVRYMCYLVSQHTMALVYSSINQRNN